MSVITYWLLLLPLPHKGTKSKWNFKMHLKQIETQIEGFPITLDFFFFLPLCITIVSTTLLLGIKHNFSQNQDEPLKWQCECNLDSNKS